MIWDLDKEDFIALVMGKSPSYRLMDNPMVEDTGSWTGGFVEEWSWDKYKLETLTEGELLVLHQLLKDDN